MVAQRSGQTVFLCEGCRAAEELATWRVHTLLVQLLGFVDGLYELVGELDSLGRGARICDRSIAWRDILASDGESEKSERRERA
jgi:hypothetical protein